MSVNIVEETIRLSRKIDELSTILDNILTGPPITATNSRTTATSTYYTGATVSIPANSVYIISGNYGDGVGSNHTIAVSFTHSGSNYTSLPLSTIQNVSSSGSSNYISEIIRTGNTAVTVGVYYYNYYTTSHTITTKITAYRLR